MATLGPNDLKGWGLPPGWDAARLAQLQLASGETYERLIADINQGLALANAALLSDPLMASMVYLSEERTIEYATGVSNGFEDHTEYGRPDAKRGKTTGHMTEPVSKDRATGWTQDFLPRARRAQIDADVASIVDDLRNVWQKTILGRWVKNTKTTVGSAGASMPFADGGTADSTYIPVNRPDRASAFAYTHQHFQRLDNITQANLETAVALLWEHGYDAPYDLLIPTADLSSWSNTTNVTGWIKRAEGLIRYGTQTDLANLGGDYIAVIETSTYGPVRVRATARIPTAYWTVYKSFGPLDSRNPIRIVSPMAGLGAEMRFSRAPVYYPLEEVLFRFEFEMTVAQRDAAVVVKNGGAYSIPTIS